MTTSEMGEVIRFLRRSVLQDGAGLTDEQLLGAFLHQRDEAAFAALVRRHAQMVWGICQRFLRNHHDAEDAFQASFLVLARKAKSIVPREMLANWLYGVAYRTALKARTTSGRQRWKERQVSHIPKPEAIPHDQDLWLDLQAVLDQELNDLPDKYRMALVVCDLEGQTRKEAARQLRIPEGTLSSRLTTARAMLAKRLARHGLEVSGGVLAAVLCQKVASAAVPPSIVSSTIKAAALVVAGKTVATGLITANVAALTEGVIKTRLLKKLKIVAIGLLVVAFGMLVAGSLLQQMSAAEPAKARTSAELGNPLEKVQQKSESKTPLDGSWMLVSRRCI